MQAIITTFLPPTNTRGSRYKAACDAGSIIVSANHTLNITENHIAACQALQRKIAEANKAKYHTTADTWEQPMISGTIPDGRHVHVFAHFPDEALCRDNRKPGSMLK